ncbi:MAG TPA: GvpL/GvpF family gas vesicle protein [Thermoanaerobaculia bacterium]|nr:GvpL/GvpF family gas vesicle protein [Thermoanaerobaculia bacterium]
MKLVAIGAHLRREDIEPLAIAVPAGALFVSALEVAGDQPLGDRELLLRATNVRAQLLARATFIAIRYGYTWEGGRPVRLADETSALRKWQRILEENRDRVEMTLKVAAASSRPRPDRHDFASGADYLRALHEATQAANIDPHFRAEVERLIVSRAVRHRWIHRDEKSIELAALIARDAVDDVRRRGEELRAGCPEVPFLLSGPWPLEVFADDDHE